MILLLLTACTGTKDDSAAPVDGLVLTDASNYSYTSDIEASSQELLLFNDNTFDWSGLTTDLLGHSVDPANDIEYIWMIQFPNLSQEEVVDAIVTDNLLAEDIGGYVQYRNNDGATSAMLSEFVYPPATAIDPATDFTDSTGTWLVRATVGIADTRMIGFAVPTEKTTNQYFEISGTTSILDFQADLSSLDGFDLTGEPSSYAVDFSGLTTHASGSEIDFTEIDQLLLGRYDGMAVTDIEDQFIDLELIASDIYTVDIYEDPDRIVDLTTAVSETSGAFSGFGADTLWVLALRCTSCTNPAPPYVTVIQVGG